MGKACGFFKDDLKPVDLPGGLGTGFATQSVVLALCHQHKHHLGAGEKYRISTPPKPTESKPAF